MNIGSNRVSNFDTTKKKIISFTFDGLNLFGVEGESLTSALIANNIKLVGRSFKYHRPRGILAFGSEEPNALFRIGQGSTAEPNIPGTQIEIYEGLVVESQNRWPSLKFDLGFINSFFSKLIPAGFYYKTFMWPATMWKNYEWFIRRAAGLGKAAEDHNDPDRYEHFHHHTDILISGGGLAGLISALVLGKSGLRILIVDENSHLGGQLLSEDDTKLDRLKCRDWAKKIEKQLFEMSNITILKRSTVFGYHDHNFITVVERCTDNFPTPKTNIPRQKLWKIRAKQVLLAVGSHERPLVISGNDKPGVMLSNAVRGYLNKFGVLAGKKVIIATNNDDAYRTAISLHKAGVQVSAIVDLRKESNSEIIKSVKKIGLKVFFSHSVTSIYGRNSVKYVEVAPITSDGLDVSSMPFKIYVDLVAMSGGWSPSVNLFSQSGGKLTWDEELGCFKPHVHFQKEKSIGACNGTFKIEEIIQESIKTSNEILTSFGKRKNNEVNIKVSTIKTNNTIRNLWLIPNGKNIKFGNKAFVDFQNDVTSDDIKLDAREGFRSVEHLKRYTTTGMATDQGKTSNINALGILSHILEKPIPEVGTTTFRMPFTPVSFGVIGGRNIKALFDPVRHTRIQNWHRENGAKFEHVGQWMRAWYYPRKKESMEDAVRREVLSARTTAGILDASTLGKIDIQGPDSTEFLNKIYTNNWSNLEIGKCRYGLMLKDDGMVMDDGVTSKLSNDHYHMTTTTGGAANVLNWLEEWLQTEWPNLKVYLTSVTEQWSVISISGPKSREILEASNCSIDLSNNNFPFMSFKEGSLSDFPVRIFRISFTGELSFEINTPARYGLQLWQTLIEKGQSFGLTPYGTEAMHVLRAERGFIIVGQETDGSVSPFDLGMGWIVSKSKHDFIGKRSLERSSMVQENRKQLVGLLSEDPKEIIPEGAHATPNPKQNNIDILGHVTSSYYSPNCRRSIAMALIKGGRKLIGEDLWLPLLNGKVIKAKVVEPIFFDPNGVRKDGI